MFGFPYSKKKKKKPREAIEEGNATRAHFMYMHAIPVKPSNTVHRIEVDVQRFGSSCNQQFAFLN